MFVAVLAVVFAVSLHARRAFGDTEITVFVVQDTPFTGPDGPTGLTPVGVTAMGTAYAITDGDYKNDKYYNVETFAAIDANGEVTCTWTIPDGEVSYGIASGDNYMYNDYYDMSSISSDGSTGTHVCVYGTFLLPAHWSVPLAVNLHFEGPIHGEANNSQDNNVGYGRGEINGIATRLERIQYRLAGVYCNSPGSFSHIGQGTSISFSAVYSPADLDPTYVVWSGAASGTGQAQRVTFNNTGNNTVYVKIAGRGGSVVVSVVDRANGAGGINWHVVERDDDLDQRCECTTLETVVTFTASADVDNNKWMLQVDSADGNAIILIHTGGYRDPVANPPISQAEAIDAVTMMKNYYTHGKGNWHTYAASLAHEQYHFTEWTTTGDHYWPATQIALGNMSVPYSAHVNDYAGAVSAMEVDANATVDAFNDVCLQYWKMLSDLPPSRPFAAGQLTLNGSIQAVQTLAAANGWIGVPAGVDTPSDANPCYQPWLPYNP
jgi:hypothetical protein